MCSIKVTILENEIDDPWSDSASKGLKMWVTNECSECVRRQKRSSLSKHIGTIQFTPIRAGILPDKIVSYSFSWNVVI